MRLKARYVSPAAQAWLATMTMLLVYLAGNYYITKEYDAQIGAIFFASLVIFWVLNLVNRKN